MGEGGHVTADFAILLLKAKNEADSCKKVFEFFLFFVLLFVRILMFTSSLGWFRTEHERFSSL